MATLTDTAYLARKGINIGVILLVAGIILRIVLGIIFGFLNPILHPPPPPNHMFGKLPYPNAQNGLASPSGTLTYTLETADGSLPTIPKVVNVYFLPTPSASFDAFNQMKAQAAKMGFTSDPKKISATQYEFTSSTSPLLTLDIDEISGNFHLQYNYASDLSLFNDKNFPAQDQIVANANSYFDNLGLLSDDLKNGQPAVTFLKLKDSNLIPTTSLSQADAVAISLSRSAVGKIPVVSPSTNQGLVSILFSGSSNQQKQILDVRYFYNPIDQENFGTYPSISAADGLTLLKSGKAIFASLPNPFPAGSAVTIREISLAYLDPYPHQSYLQPVLVFSDQKGFVAYVPAVAPDWLQ